MRVLLHGFTGDPSGWDGFGGDLVPALLGHGDRSEVRTFEEEADRIARLIRGPAHLCGYSLGARVALGMLVRHPGLFSRATLIGVNPGLEGGREERARADEAWAQMLEREGIEKFADAWAAQDLFATQTEEMRAAERRRRLRKDPRELARSLRVLGLAQMPNYWPVLSELPMPIQLIVGSEDRKFLAIAQRMLPLLRQGSLTVIEGARHNVPLERPGEIKRVLA